MADGWTEAYCSFWCNVHAACADVYFYIALNEKSLIANEAYQAEYRGHQMKSDSLVVASLVRVVRVLIGSFT